MPFSSYEKFAPALAEYIRTIEQKYSSGIAGEHAYRGALEALLKKFDVTASVINEPKRIQCGAPDYIIARREVPIGYIEAKDIELPALKPDELPERDREQIDRYKKGLSNLILTNYLDFNWIVNGEEKFQTSIGIISRGKVLRNEAGMREFYSILTQFFTTASPIVKTSKELAQRMAAIAKIICDALSRGLNKEDDAGPLHQKLKGFREILLHDMQEGQFADMYAQTIAYGLFAARCNHKKEEPFTRRDASRDLPKTNPFLKKMFQSISDDDLDEENIDWAVDDLAELLSRADMGLILKNFGKRTRQQDPVVHFYETFLAAYDPKLREMRGVYYTPEPVVSYIIRSVDFLLKHEFGLRDGLADRTKIKIGKGKDEREVHKVLMLDPATGTGTFLHGIIDEIFTNHFKEEPGMWSSYVSQHLLPRLFGFELLMAPYAVAHMKLGLQLQEFGYDFKSNERLGVYLTNTLEEANKYADTLFAQWLSDEANAASRIKSDAPVMIVLGNPPYSGISANMSEEIMGTVEPYRFVDGNPLGERKVWLQNDYVKFIRFGQTRIEQTGEGILAFITDNSYLDNPTFRGMRQNLMNSFDRGYFLNLRGNSKQAKGSPTGETDESVFQIRQGVAIAIYVKLPKSQKQVAKEFYYSEIWGKREIRSETGLVIGGKYAWLSSHNLHNTEWQSIHPQSPFYFFIPRKSKAKKEIAGSISVVDLMPRHGLGYQTSRDDLVIDFDRESLEKKINRFIDPKRYDAEIRDEFFPGKKVKDYEPGDTRQWSLSSAREELRKTDWKSSIRKTLYRPFDFRYCLYDTKMVDWPRSEMLRHFLEDENNLGLIIGRQGEATGAAEWDVTFVSSEIFDQNIFRRGGGSLFPLRLVNGNGNGELFYSNDTKFNINVKLMTKFQDRLGLKTISGRQVFDYLYSLLYSRSYRKRFAEELERDFPRVPLTSNVKLFRNLVIYGHDLISLHLMEKIGPKIIRFPKKGSDTVEFVKYAEDTQRVHINKEQYFEGVSSLVWNFHIGGYQVAEKWLKDRKGRTLSHDDKEHYRDTCSALSETTNIMAAIDKTINANGGWPIR